MSELNRIYKKYKARVQFYVVYIREAHPVGSRRPDRRLSVREPRTLLERAGVARTCAVDLKLKLPLLIDDLKNSTEKAYSAWPDRLFLVDRKGKIAYRGGRGPRGFEPAELETAIKKALAPRARKKKKGRR